MILVSGGTGLVGSHLLVELVNRGNTVRAIYRKENSIEKCKKLFEKVGAANKFSEIEWKKADLLDINQLDDCFIGVNQVYHSAAVVSFKSKDYSRLMEVNVEGTANMVNLALDHAVEKFCYVSSVAALGKYRDGSCSDEQALWQKQTETSAYSISKFYAENEVWRAAEEGLNMVIVNPATIIGFGELEESSTTIIKKVIDGLKFYPSGSNGFVGVTDVVKAMTQLMESDIKHERFVLVSENLSFKKLFDTVAEAFGVSAPKIKIDESLAKLYLTFEKLKGLFGIESMISASTIKTAYANRCYSSSKIETELNFKFNSISKELEKTAALFSA